MPGVALHHTADDTKDWEKVDSDGNHDWESDLEDVVESTAKNIKWYGSLRSKNILLLKYFGAVIMFSAKNNFNIHVTVRFSTPYDTNNWKLESESLG